MASFFKKVLPANVYEYARRSLLFRPDDPNKLAQQVPQMFVEDCGVERIKGYRFPAPGSQPKPMIPARDHEDELYDNAFFKRDTTELDYKDDITFNDSNQTTISNYEKKGLARNYKRRKPKYAYDDEFQLRTAKAVTKEATQAFMKQYVTEHWPKPAWHEQIDDIIADCKKKGIPVTPGRRYKYKDTPEEYNQVRW